jgi:hypothetical protein
MILKHNSHNLPRVRVARMTFAYAGGLVYGGPYADLGSVPNPRPPLGLLRINMAPEVKAPSDLLVPTRDFGVPPEELFKFALHAAAKTLVTGGTVYVGCGYGIGRTGTFIAALCKLNREVLYLTRRGWGMGDDAVRDPVEEVRELYLERAVETREQAQFVRSLDLFWVARRIAARIKPTVLFDKRFWGA